MIYTFKTEDKEELYVLDTNPEVLTWARASTILATPSLTAAENEVARYVPIEEGKLVPGGGGNYTFDGRNPREYTKKGLPTPLVSVSILSLPVNDTLHTYLAANVRIKEDSFELGPIKKFQCHVVQAPKVDAPPTVAIPANDAVEVDETGGSRLSKNLIQI